MTFFIESLYPYMRKIPFYGISKRLDKLHFNYVEKHIEFFILEIFRFKDFIPVIIKETNVEVINSFINLHFSAWNCRMNEPTASLEQKSIICSAERKRSLRARYSYGIIFMLTNFSAWFLRDYGEKVLPQLQCMSVFFSWTVKEYDTYMEDWDDIHPIYECICFKFLFSKTRDMKVYDAVQCLIIILFLQIIKLAELGDGIVFIQWEFFAWV